MKWSDVTVFIKNISIKVSGSMINKMEQEFYYGMINKLKENF